MKPISIITNTVPTKWLAMHNHAYSEAFFEPRSHDSLSVGAIIVLHTWSNAVDSISVALKRGNHAVLRSE